MRNPKGLENAPYSP